MTHAGPSYESELRQHLGIDQGPDLDREFYGEPMRYVEVKTHSERVSAATLAVVEQWKNWRVTHDPGDSLECCEQSRSLFRALDELARVVGETEATPVSGS